MQSTAKGKACTLCQIAPWWPDIIASRRRLQGFQKDFQLDNLWENGPRPSHLMTSTNTFLMRLWVLVLPVGYTGHLLHIVYNLYFCIVSFNPELEVGKGFSLEYCL